MSCRSVLGSVSPVSPAWRVSAVLALALAPLSGGCDALKHNDVSDAAVVAPPVTPAVPATTAAPGTPAPPVTTVAPLGGAVAPAPGAGGVKPAGDAGKPAATAGGAAAADGGKTAPAPTPTFTIPTAIPGFDAGAFKPPPGFPSTIPTFPQPPPAGR
jgi:hypothetical protein